MKIFLLFPSYKEALQLKYAYEDKLSTPSKT